MKTEKKARPRHTGSIFRKVIGRTDDGTPIFGNTWNIQFYKDGRRIREYTGLTNRVAAQKELTDRLGKVDRNEYAKRESRPVRIEELFASLEAHNESNEVGRPRELQWRWGHLGPAFAAMPAKNLTTDHVRAYINDRKREGAAAATVNRELATLRRMFNLERQSTPPKVSATPYFPMLKEAKPRQGFVTDDDFSRLVAQPMEGWLRLFLELGFSYGWRKGELLGLRIRQVDLRERTIRLDTGTTKNGEGRQVSMTGKVAELLRLATEGKAPDAYVLTRADGQRVKEFRVAWKKLCEGAGLPNLIPHDLRRSAAKALRAAAVPESVIMQMGGWKTASMFRRYAIVSSSDGRDAVAKLEQARVENGRLSAAFSAETGDLETSATSREVQ